MSTTTVEMPFTFAVPQVFDEILFSRSAEERANITIENLNALDPKPTEEQILQAVITKQAVVESLAQSGAAYSAILIARSEKVEDKLVSATFSVMIRPSEFSDQETVERLAKTVALLHPTAEVGAIKLPCGVAVLIADECEVPKSVTLLGKGREPTTVCQCHVIVPIPGRTALADFSISTDDIEEWDDYVEILAGICASIQFHEQDQDQQDHENGQTPDGEPDVGRP